MDLGRETVTWQHQKWLLRVKINSCVFPTCNWTMEEPRILDSFRLCEMRHSKPSVVFEYPNRARVAALHQCFLCDQLDQICWDCVWRPLSFPALSQTQTSLIEGTFLHCVEWVIQSFFKLTHRKRRSLAKVVEFIFSATVKTSDLHALCLTPLVTLSLLCCPWEGLIL